jgi:steroid delta-isomerase-like uncharacterized protein
VARAASQESAKLVARRLFEEPWSGNLGVIDELVAIDYRGHDSAEREAVRGPKGLKDLVERYRSAFAGTTLTVEDQIADGRQVATRWTARGTHVGEIAGIGPTGKDVTVSGLTISRFAAGKIVEQWTTWDTLSMLVQLGVVPSSVASEASS